MKKENFIAKLLFYIGIIIIFGSIIIGFMSGNLGRTNMSLYSSQFSLLVFISSSIRGIIIGMLFIGFSEVIHLLQDIFNSHRRLSSDMQVIRSNAEDAQNKPLE